MHIASSCDLGINGLQGFVHSVVGHIELTGEVTVGHDSEKHQKVLNGLDLHLIAPTHAATLEIAGGRVDSLIKHLMNRQQLGEQYPFRSSYKAFGTIDRLFESSEAWVGVFVQRGDIGELV